MCLRCGKDELILGGCEDGSLVAWDGRKPDKELSIIKLFTDSGTVDLKNQSTAVLIIVVMCLDYHVESNHGVAGSPLKTLETFNITQQVWPCLILAQTESIISV